MSNYEERSPRGGGHRSVLTWIAVVAALAGAFALVVAFRAQRSAPTPPSEAAGTLAAPEPTSDRGTTSAPTPSVGGAKQHPLPVSEPERIEIPSIFFDLGDLRPGDPIRITRADGTLVTFTVDGVRDYPQKSDFPTGLVYGGDLSRPNLRLVTCSNFDFETRHYVGNLVVFAHMTAVRKADA